ncbi:MAG: hypothetical protein HW421_2593 [Ignavibacteria bacterium]|nr:hypothetical protein [Ignavibacteria bacterium]
MILKLPSLIIIFIIFLPSYLFAKGTAGNAANLESRFIVDMPTAGVIPEKSFGFYAQFFNNGGLALELSAAPFESFSMAIAFSGSNIIGSDEPVFQKYPGVHIRYRLLDETISFPAITAGISTQGRGIYSKTHERFATLSPGLFLASSKAFRWALGQLSFHGGIGFSFEAATPDKAPNYWLGLEQSVGNNFSFNLEYNAQLDDNNRLYLSKRGLLNAAFRLSVAGGLTLELSARDLLIHQTRLRGFTRFIGLEFISRF